MCARHTNIKVSGSETERKVPRGASRAKTVIRQVYRCKRRLCFFRLLKRGPAGTRRVTRAAPTFLLAGYPEVGRKRVGGAGSLGELPSVLQPGTQVCRPMRVVYTAGGCMRGGTPEAGSP